MKLKTIFKWILIQLVLLVLLLLAIEFVYFLLLKYHANAGCASFDLPLNAIPYQKDAKLGYINPADTVIHLYSLQSDSSSRNINYSLDTDHWRITVNNNTSARQYAIFLGSSYTFGLGLDDPESIASKFAKYNPAFHAYNFSVNGYGTSNLLAGFEENRFKKLVQQPNGICLYTFVDYHINRNIGDMNTAGKWAQAFPYYKASGDSVAYAGSFKTTRPVLTFLYSLLAKSNFIKYYKLNFPKIKDGDIELTARIIKQAERLYTRQFGNDNFYVLIYPNQYFDIRPYLKKHNIKYIDFPALNLSDPKFKLWCDDHPSAEATDSLCRLLSTRLKADSLQSLPGGK